MKLLAGKVKICLTVELFTTAMSTFSIITYYK